jgi:aminoglycoside phosphotransferase family enzyme
MYFVGGSNMSAIRNPRLASPELLAHLSLLLSPSQKDNVHPSDSNSVCQCYKIELLHTSESATVLFLRDMDTEKRMVIKILNKCIDTRYRLDKRTERQQCQLKALHWNKVFTPTVYEGLARIHSFDHNHLSICIDKIISKPDKEMLDPCAEYGLVIHELPQEGRLDNLLEKEKGNEDVLERYIELLAKRVAQMHVKVNPTILPSSGERIHWGSVEQLKKKLDHNLAFADLILTKIEREYYSSCGRCLISVRDTLTQVFEQKRYQRYFKQRVQEHFIKHCHGDLKAPNIWIASDEKRDDEKPFTSVWILDAIDFNDIYSNIDVLSDIATLIVDIQARTNSPAIANRLLEKYMECSMQQNDVALSVLSYYLVEKALVGAILAIGYDDLPELGLSFLEVAETRSRCLLEKEYKTVSVADIKPPVPLEEMQIVGGLSGFTLVSSLH